MSDAPLIVQSDGHVRIIVLNRPERLNSTTDELGFALEDALMSAGTDRGVRAIVLTGAGGHFCAGGDVARLREILDSGGAALDAPPPDAPDARFDRLGDAPPETRSRYLLPMAVPQPVIAAIDGICAGAGLVLAAASDIRIAAPTARFNSGFALRGLIAESGIAFLLSHLVGRGAASELLLAGRTIDASEALRIGLVNSLTDGSPALETALVQAHHIARSVSPRSAAIVKRQIFAAQSDDLAAAAMRSYREMRRSFLSADFAEGLTAFIEKRPPLFADRPSQGTTHDQG